MTAASQPATTSSITNSTPVIGVLKAAAMPAAAPIGAIMRMVRRVNPKIDPSRDARPAPISSAGSSGPSGVPVPIESTQAKNFPGTAEKGMRPSET